MFFKKNYNPDIKDWVYYNLSFTYLFKAVEPRISSKRSRGKWYGAL